MLLVQLCLSTFQKSTLYLVCVELSCCINTGWVTSSLFKTLLTVAGNLTLIPTGKYYKI